MLAGALTRQSTPKRAAVTAPRDGADLAAIKALFQAYAAALDFDLCFQDFDQEMAEFPGKYVEAMGGALLLATWDADPVGAVALRDLGNGVCEMKRLYLEPTARGTGLGRRLVAALIDLARARGYRVMRLDTVPGQHDAAIALYRAVGFREIAPYCHNPVPGALFFECLLDLPSSA